MTRLVALACALVLLAACASGRKPYANDQREKNLNVKPELAGVRGAMHIHRVDGQCQTEYLGSLDLDRRPVAVGLPADGVTYLVFDFSSSSLLRGSARTTQGTLFKPKAGHLYEIAVTYKDDIYGVVVREAPPHGRLRELPLLDFASCKKA